MRLVLFLLLVLASPAFAADTIEGPNIPTGPFLVVGGQNCQPQAGADYTSAWIFVRRPGSHGEGPVVVTHCEYHATDLLPALPTTAGSYWLYMKSTCNDPTLAAVCTRWQRIDWRGGGGDTGCDEPGPAPTPGWTPAGMLTRLGRLAVAPYRMIRPKKPRPRTKADRIEFGRCHTDAGRTVCVPDPRPKTP